MFHYTGLTTAWHHASMAKQQTLFILFNEDAKLERKLIFIASEAQFCASSEAGISTLQHYLYLASLWALCCHSNLILLSILSGWELRRWIKCLKRKCRTTGLGTKSRSFKESKIMAKKRWQVLSAKHIFHRQRHQLTKNGWITADIYIDTLHYCISFVEM